MKAIIFDSGTIINFSMNSLLYILEALKQNFQGKFLITKAVKYEVLDKPLKTPRFQLEALRVQRLLENKTLELPEALKISESEINKKSSDFLNKANQLIQVSGNPIEIVSQAEMSCLALSSLLTNKKIPNLIAIDERTTRILSEKPENLEQIMSRKLHKKASFVSKNFSQFKQFKFIRSSELAYTAHKKGLLKVKGKKALEAVLYATKFKGSSISFDEIDVLKKL